MGYEVVLQPNGYLAVWSNTTDNYSAFNQSRSGIFALLKQFNFRFNEALHLFLSAYDEANKNEWNNNLRFILAVRGAKEKEEVEAQDNLMSPEVYFGIEPFAFYKNGELLTVFQTFSDFKQQHVELMNYATKNDTFALRDGNHKTLFIIVDKITYISKDWLY